MDLLAMSIPSLTDYQLMYLAKDAEYRLGSHVAGGNPVDEYVERQRKILSLIQDELRKRK